MAYFFFSTPFAQDWFADYPLAAEDCYFKAEGFATLHFFPV